MRKKDSTKAERERLRRAAEDLETISDVYANAGGVSRAHRWHLSANINRAADLAGVRYECRTYPERYERAEKALRGASHYGAIRAVRRACEEIRAVWERPEGMTPEEAAPPRRAPKKTPPEEAEIYYVGVRSDDATIIGYVKGETLVAEEARRTLKVGDPASAWHHPDDKATTGRVVAADADTFTLRTGRHAEHTFDRRTCAWAGLVVGVESKFTEEEEKRLDALRKRLEGVDADDITSSTALLKIEREIYDIEHPKDADDWGAWEETGGAR
jgi:hypothetical protein